MGSSLQKQKSNSNGCFAYCPLDFVDQENGRVEIRGHWRRQVGDVQEMIQINSKGSNNFARIAKEVRDNFKEYFNSVQGSIPWRDKVDKNSTTNAFGEKHWVFGTVKLIKLILIVTDS